jgi:hypothetical protein
VEVGGVDDSECGWRTCGCGGARVGDGLWWWWEGLCGHGDRERDRVELLAYVVVEKTSEIRVVREGGGKLGFFRPFGDNGWRNSGEMLLW